MPNNSDAEFAELEKAVEDEISFCRRIGMVGEHLEIITRLHTNFAAFKASRGQERQEYPVGTVVFVPDGEPRYAKKGEYVGSKDLSVIRLADNDFDPDYGAVQVYRRIDIALAPKVEKTRPVGSIVEEMEVTSYANSTIDSLKEDVVEALRAIERRLAGEKV